MSPDLGMRILIENLDWDRARTIARATQVEGSVPVYTGPQRFLFRAQPPELGTIAVHDLLADSADWNAETWDMEPEQLPRLVRTFEILFTQISGGFSIEVMWAGDEPRKEHAVSREEMLDIVRRGKIATRTRYHIEAAVE